MKRKQKGGREKEEDAVEVGRETRKVREGEER